MRRVRTMFVGVLLAAGCGDDGAGSGGDSEGATSGASSGDAGSSGETDASSSTAGGSGSDSATSGASASSSGTDTGAGVECTSQTYWTKGDLESPLMHPGRACLDCHAMQIGEDVVGRFAIAGTVYPTLHEPDECNGVAGTSEATVVEITGADQQVITLAVNSAGNFMYDLEESPPILFPIKAKVRRGGMEVAMATAQMSGDCNACHTEAGKNGAPGRIVAP